MIATLNSNIQIKESEFKFENIKGVFLYGSSIKIKITNSFFS